MSDTFDNLFVCDMANNHQGSKEHGKKIIDGMAGVAEKRNVKIGIKFQYRELDTFIHPAFRERKDVKHIDRFLSTRLSREEFGELVEYAKSKGLIAISTPYDEPSVEQCLELDIDILKIASCSVMDWPLLEEVAKASKPVIVSTGGIEIADVDKVVSFFTNKKTDFALMHCVGIYPTPNEQLNMDTVARFIRRYPHLPIGYSGHEEPDNILPAVVAISKGARLIERHVGVETDEIKLNKYSMTPEQTDAWVDAALKAQSISGSSSRVANPEEQASLKTLMRGTYAKHAIKKGERIAKEDVYYAMPLQEGQLISGEFGRYRTTYIASENYEADAPICEEPQTDEFILARSVVHEAMGMLNEAGISVSDDAEVELSHHFGMNRFREVGATIINIVNREYCKKLIVMLPGQTHPRHKHEKKEETFELLYGDIEVHLEGETKQIKPGEQLLVKRNSWHSFATENGAIFEEISTTHERGDSYYEDEAISELDPMQRKTVIRTTGNF